MGTPDTHTTTEDNSTSRALPATRSRFTVGHLSDVHLGRKQYQVNAGNGRNQREADMSLAYQAVVKSIAEADPDLVIDSGDRFDSSRPALRHILLSEAGLRLLSEDGRVVILIAGNHDMPSDAGEASPVDLHATLDNVFVATRRYEVVDLTPLVDAGKARETLRKVAVHLLPHEALRGADWDQVVPWEGYTNILVSHCVVGGSELYRRAVGREYALPIDVVTRGWHYVALGHYHKQGPVAVGGFSDANTPAWYAGSTENNGFSDVRDGKTDGRRGWLQVTVDPYDKVPTVRPVDLPIRSMFRLPVIDAAGLDHAAISAKMLAMIAASDVTGAVVRQPLVNVDADAWGQVDLVPVRRAASAAMVWEPDPKFHQASTDLDGEEGETQPLGDLASVLDDTLGTLYAEDPYRDDIADLARKLLGDALGVPAGPASCCDEGAPTDSGHTDSGHTHAVAEQVAS